MNLLTGMGETWSSVFARFVNAQPTALDFSLAILQQAVRRNHEHYRKGVKIEEQNVLSNSLADHQYDVVVCAYGLKTFDQEQLTVPAAETYRILKAGGQFVFVEVSQPDNALLRKLYGFYLGRVIPVLGRLLLGKPVEYRMLWTYTRRS